jgi:hypothetical protein
MKQDYSDAGLEAAMQSQEAMREILVEALQKARVIVQINEAICPTPREAMLVMLTALGSLAWTARADLDATMEEVCERTKEGIDIVFEMFKQFEDDRKDLFS